MFNRIYMLNQYQKRLMAEGFLLRLQEAEDKVVLVMELMDEMLQQNDPSPVVSRMQYAVEVDKDAKELDGRFEFERRQE